MRNLYKDIQMIYIMMCIVKSYYYYAYYDNEDLIHPLYRNVFVIKSSSLVYLCGL